MDVGIRDIASSLQLLEKLRMNRRITFREASGGHRSPAGSGRLARPAGSGRAPLLARSLLLFLLCEASKARGFLTALLASLAIGGLTHGAWTVITWTPLPPQRFAADLGKVPAWQRNADCTRLALSKARGPYDASMLRYAFDPAAGLCHAIEQDGFRERVLQARMRHEQVAWVLAVLAMLASLAWLLQRGRDEEEDRPAPRRA